MTILASEAPEDVRRACNLSNEGSGVRERLIGENDAVEIVPAMPEESANLFR
jgi:hypothetical protein